MTLLGLSGTDWTAIGSIATVISIAVTLLVAYGHRGGSAGREDSSSGRANSPTDDATDDEPAPKWPPDAHFEAPETPPRLRPVRSGNDLLGLVRSAQAYEAGSDDPRSTDEAEQLADAQSTIFGWVEASDVIDDPGEWVRAGFELTELIEDLKAKGWTVYGTLVPKRLVVGDQSMPWSTAVLRIKRATQAQAA